MDTREIILNVENLNTTFISDKRLERIRRIYSVRNMPIVSVTWQEKRAKCMEREFELRAYKAPMEENPFEMKGSVIKILRQVVT